MRSTDSKPTQMGLLLFLWSTHPYPMWWWWVQGNYERERERGRGPHQLVWKSWPLIKGSSGGCGEMWICAWKGTALVFTKGPTLMQRRLEVMDDGVGPRIFGLTQNFFLWSFQPLKVTWIKASCQCIGAVPRTREWDPTLTQCKMMGVDHRQVCVGVGVPHQELFLLEYVLDVLSQIMDGWGALNWKGIL